MLEDDFTEEMKEIMQALDLPFIALNIHGIKEYYFKADVSKIPLDKQSEILEDMKITYEKLTKEPWYRT